MSAAVNKYAQPITRLAAALIGACVPLALSGCLWNSSNPPPPTYSLSATVSGLNSSGLVLAVNGTPVSVAPGATEESLTSWLPAGSSYFVAVQTQPTGKTCSVAGGAGTVQSANVANVVVTCSSKAYSLGGSISGLNGSGLVLANGSDTLAVSSGSTSFTMPSAVAYGSSYTVTVQTQPAGLACAVNSGTGTMPANDVTSVAVTCTDQPFSLGGTIVGLGNNTGLVLANGSDTLDVSAGSTSFTMPSAVAFGSAYAVTVQASPSEYTCTPSSASGTMPAANVTNVVITCSLKSYSVGGTISGLTSTGLVLANASDTLPVSSGTSAFTMPTAVAFGSAYAVTVKTQPTGLTCSVANGTGTMGGAAVSNVAVTCSANTYTVGGTISGLSASGLVLLDNGADATTINANATQFTMNTGVAYGSGYAVTVQSQPTGLVCTVSTGSGTVGAADVTNVSIACVSNFTLLYSFAGGSDGANPHYGLIQANNGNFYGTTLNGGANNGGTIFEMTPSGTESVFYSFASSPFATLMQASDGNFYGTTAFDGANGTGTVFKITPSAIETDLYSFPAGSSQPFSGVIQGSDGDFYGATGALGSSDDGIVFRVTPTGTETTLHVFAQSGPDGEIPYKPPVEGSNGNFYGTTNGGGAHGFGTVYVVTPTGTETVLYSFAGGSDAANPESDLILGSDGNFYGTTEAGGTSGVGTVYKITPSGTETVLYSFAGGSSDGANPSAGVTQASDGNFYGVTYAGGASNFGTVYKLTPSGIETVLHTFAGSDGASSQTDLVLGSDGNLYGTTRYGGASSDGAFFRIRLH